MPEGTMTFTRHGALGRPSRRSIVAWSKIELSISLLQPLESSAMQVTDALGAHWWPPVRAKWNMATLRLCPETQRDGDTTTE